MAALNVEQIQGTANIIQKELVKTPVLNYHRELARLGFRIITGIQFKHTTQLMSRRSGVTRRYHKGMAQNEESGKASKRELQVSICTAPFVDNIADYQAVDADGNEGKVLEPNYKWPYAVSIMQGQADSYAEDIAMNLFHGDKSLGEDHPLGMFDGINTQLNRDITNGLVKPISISAIVAPADDTDTSAYDAALEFYNGLHQAMKDAERVIIVCSPETATAIKMAQLNKFKNSPLITDADANEGERLIGASNVRICPTWMAGKGDRLFAVLPNWADFGVDDTAAETYVRVTTDPKDGNIVNTQIQAKVGCRLNDVRERVFAVSDGSLEMAEQMGGDYAEAIITAAPKVAGTGTIAITNAAGETITTLKRGESATLTPTGASSKNFSKWSDNGSTTAVRTVIGTGLPAAFQAEFA